MKAYGTFDGCRIWQDEDNRLYWGEEYGHTGEPMTVAQLDDYLRAVQDDEATAHSDLVFIIEATRLS